MPALRFTGTVTKGRVSFDQPERWAGNLARFEGKRIEVSLQALRKSRSSQQNRYYWSVVVPIFGEWTGETKDEAHNTLKTIHNQVERVLPSGELIREPGSTAKLTTGEFSAYVERVCVWCAQQGVYIPPPGHVEEVGL
jgi:hypothetical protein